MIFHCHCDDLGIHTRPPSYSATKDQRRIHEGKVEPTPPQIRYTGGAKTQPCRRVARTLIHPTNAIVEIGRYLYRRPHSFKEALREMVFYPRVIVFQTNTSVNMEGAKAQPCGGSWVARSHVKGYHTMSPTLVGISIDCCIQSPNKVLQDWVINSAKTNTSAKAQEWKRPQLCGLGWHERILRSFDPV